MRLVKIVVIGMIFLGLSACRTEKEMPEKNIPDIALQKTSVKTELDGMVFRDLNKNGKLDVYEDINAPVEERVNDLVSQMTLEEKAGAMFMPGVPVNEDGTLEKNPNAAGPGARYPAAIENIDKGKLNHFNVWSIPPEPRLMAVWYNRLQQYAEQSRLGIPVTIASDPRHHFSNTLFSMAANGFTQFSKLPDLLLLGMILWLKTLQKLCGRNTWQWVYV